MIITIYMKYIISKDIYIIFLVIKMLIKLFTLAFILSKALKHTFKTHLKFH